MKLSAWKTGRPTQWGGTVLLATLLAACGGGDETSTTNTNPTDTSATKDPAITLSGKVYDGPIANAAVTITVDGETFTATAGADGVYTLDISSSDPAAFITITATGAAGQEFIELISFAGTFAALSDAAGSDSMLESSESGAVAVTNLSTAKAVLILEANGGVQPTDDAELTDLEKTIDGAALLELATVIKLVIDEGVALPAGSVTTLDLVQDNNAIDTVIADAEAANPGIFDATLDAILADPNLLTPITAEDVPELYLLNLADCFVCANRGFVVESLQGGAGHIYGSGSAVSADMTWSIGSEGQVVIAIDAGDPLVIRAGCDTTSGNVDCVTTVTSLDIRLLTDGTVVDTVAVRQLGTVTYPNHVELADAAVDRTRIRLGMEPAALERFTTADITGTWSVPLSFPNPDPVGDEYEADLLTFNNDGTGTRPADGAAFSWLVDADGVLKTTFNNGDKLDVYWLRPDGELGMDAMVVMTTAGGDTYTLPQLIVKGVDTAYAGTLVLADFDGERHYTDYPGYVYVIDSVAGTATGKFYDENGVVVDEYTDQALYDGIKLELLAWVDVENQQGVPNCSGVITCYNDYSSTWRPLAKDSSGRIYLLEKDHGWDFNAAASANFYRGAMYYKHGFNRWLEPATGGGMAKRGISAGPVVERGTRVRAALGNPLADMAGRR